MTDPTFAQRFGVVDGITIYADFPERAQVGLLYVLRNFVGRNALNKRALVIEIPRIVRHVSTDEEPSQLSLELPQELRWCEFFELIERVCSALLEPVGEWVDFNHWEEFESIEEVREAFTREINQLLWEENIAYEFIDCTFKRRGRPHGPLAASASVLGIGAPPLTIANCQMETGCTCFRFC